MMTIMVQTISAMGLREADSHFLRPVEASSKVPKVCRNAPFICAPKKQLCVFFASQRLVQGHFQRLCRNIDSSQKYTTLTSNHTSYQLCQLGNSQKHTFVWLLVGLSIFVCCQFLKNRKIILLEFQLILTTERISNWKGQASQKAEEEAFLRMEVKKYNEELKFITASSSGILFFFAHSFLDIQCICTCLIRYSHSEVNPRNK